MAQKRQRMDLAQFLQQLDKMTTKQREQLEQIIRDQYLAVGTKIDQHLFKLDTKKGGLSYEEAMKYNRLEKIQDQIKSALDDLARQNYQALVAGLQDNYIETYSFFSYALEAVTGANLDFAFPKADTLNAVIENPVKGLTLKDTLEKNRNEIIYQIKGELTRSIYNGEAYKETADRLKECLDGDYKKAIRIVRTESHRVSQKGQMDSAEDAHKQGIKQTKTWNTMQDERVRPQRVSKTKKGWKHSMGRGPNHMRMEGVTVAADENFKTPDGVEGPGPGSMGVAGHDINCRCFLTYDVEKVEAPPGAEKPTPIEEEPMPFEEWKEDKKEQSELLGIKSGKELFDYETDANKRKAFVQLPNELEQTKFNTLARSKRPPEGLNPFSPYQKTVCALNMHDKPTVLSEKAYNAVDSIPLYRGVTGHNGLTAKQINEWTKYGDTTFIGEGVYGDGIYLSNWKDSAASYTTRFTDDPDSANVMEAKIKPGTKMIDDKKLQAAFNKYKRMAGDWREDPNLVFEAGDSMDLSTYALSKGYQVIEHYHRTVDGEKEYYYNVLDRSVLLVKEKGK